MHYVGAFFRTVGMFWGITIITVVVAGGTVFGLMEAGFWADQKVAQHQGVINNAQYQANQQSQQYQDTYKQQADKTYEQLAIDKYDIATAKSSGDTTAQQDAYAAAQSDIHSFCTYAQELTPETRATLGPNELGVYNANC